MSRDLLFVEMRKDAYLQVLFLDFCYRNKLINATAALGADFRNRDWTELLVSGFHDAFRRIVRDAYKGLLGLQLVAK